MKSRYVIIIIGSLVGILLLLGVAFARRKPPSPIAVLTPEETRIESSQVDGDVAASFQILNRGEQDLSIGKITTTSGCTIASVSTTVVPPGKAAVVNLTATPPQAGEKTVDVHVPINSITEGDAPRELRFRLRLIGTMTPPFVRVSSGPVQLGEAQPEDARTEMIVETTEAMSVQPWIERAIITIPDMRADGGPEHEVELPGGIVARRYRYKVGFVHPPGPGILSGELQLKTRDDEIVLALPIVGRILPAIFPQPSRLYASFSSALDVPELHFSVVASDPGFHLEAKPNAVDEAQFGIALRSRTDSRLNFVLTPYVSNHDVSTNIVLDTNHPDVKRVVVPVTLLKTPN